MAPAEPSTREKDALAEEVRVAMALNGGVSLAVWMGGCVTELDCARRAHLSAEPIAKAPTRRVYNTICKAFHRVLVVDLMSGSSAGGINGALLGAAIRHKRRLHPDFLRDRWLELGDFEKLLHRTSEPSPAALMQGTLFHSSLKAAFDDLLAGKHGTELPAEQAALPELDVSLDVTTTNVEGEPREYLDYWERPLYAREYRARFRFRTKADYTAEMLAVASRASASFPGAFEPWRVEAPAGDLAGFTGSRWVVDGGLLDNAPIGAALELIPSRRADRQVRRYVCYMNAEPPEKPGATPSASTNNPTLTRIGGYVLGLPRKAPFVDQLNAIERATRAGTLGSGRSPALDLLFLDLDVLEQTAEKLLPSYQQGRHLLSLEELLADPARARRAHNALLEDDEPLPWVPTSLAARRDGAWQWGLRPAERVLQLVLDVIRAATRYHEVADHGDRTAAGNVRVARRLRLFAAVEAVGTHLGGIEDAARCFAQTDPGYGSVEDALLRARAHIESFDPLPPLKRAAAVLHDVRDDLEVEGGRLAKWLFGADADAPHLSDAGFELFLRRALAIEVVRRAVAPDDEPLASGQELRFAQITPYAPAWIFAKAPSTTDEGWKTPEEKLTGLALGHFAGFYRGSWRINDFMWGRLDAATRIVDLLVAPGRAEQLLKDGTREESPAEILVNGLLQGDDGKAPEPEQLWLIDEALRAAAGQPPPAEGDAPPAADKLRRDLLAALEKDLTEPSPAEPRRRGDLTRRICARAAQLEILIQELPKLDAASSKDVGLGAGAPALKLSFDRGVRDAITKLREEPSLRKRLTADDEIVSALAIRTSTQAALVTLGVLRAAKMPLARFLFGVRAGLLPVAGSVAKHWLNRLGVVVAFYAATLFLAGRLLTTHRDDFEHLKGAALTAMVVALFAALVVIGTALVPLLRALFAENLRRRIGQGLWAFSIVASGGLVAAILSWHPGGVSLDRLITAPHAQRPPDAVLTAVVAFVLGGPILAVPAFARGWLNKLLLKAGWVSLIVVAVLAVFVIGYSIGDVWHFLRHGNFWQTTVAILSLFVAPLVVLANLFLRPALNVLGRLRRQLW